METSEYGTEPLVVVTNDGSKWINVEDVDEFEWLMKKKIHVLENVNLKTSKTRQSRERRRKHISEILQMPTEPEKYNDITAVAKKKNIHRKWSQTRHSQDNPIVEEVSHVYATVNKIIDRLRGIQRQLASVQCDPTIFNPESNPAVETDHSKWRSVEDANEVERLFGKSQLKDTILFATDACEANITKLQVVAEKIGRRCNIRDKKRVNEKIVCVEYDLLTKDTKDLVKKMRAFLSIKTPKVLPTAKCTNESLPNIDLVNNGNNMQLTDEEIKMIDKEINEKKGYLDKLRNNLKSRSFNLQKQQYRAVTTENISRSNSTITKSTKRIFSKVTLRKHHNITRLNDISKHRRSITNSKFEMMYRPKSNLESQLRKVSELNSETDGISAPVECTHMNMQEVNNMKSSGACYKKESFLKYKRQLKHIDIRNENVNSVFANVQNVM